MFSKERAAPFHDLVALMQVRPGLRVADLGCGSGELTLELAELLPQSEVVGIDNSREMLAEAKKLSAPGLRFESGNLEELSGRWDIIFSNAAIHWVGNHDRLIPRLLSLLEPDGQILVQIPSNNAHLTHRLIREMATQSPFAEVLQGWSRESTVLPIEDYAEILFRAGARDIVVFQKVYPHVLADADALVDWTKGTALIPYMERLPAELHESFMTRYREAMRRHFARTPVLYTYKRTLFSAKAAGRGSN